MYGILWFSFSALVEVLNICNGRDLGAKPVVVYVGGCLSVFWYLYGLLLRMSNGGRVAAGDYIPFISDEEYEASKDLYLIRSGIFLYWYLLAMPFFVVLCIFLLCIISYIRGEMKVNEYIERK